MSSLFDYRFRTKVYPDSLYGKLCRFLKGKEPEFQQPEWKESEMVLEASSAYCLPLAFKRLNEIGKCSEAELKHCGRVSIHKLIMRVYFLAQVCGLEGELTLIPVLGSHPPHYISNGSNGIANESNGMGGTRKTASLPEENPEQPIKELTVQELLHHQDDETFETIFGQQ